MTEWEFELGQMLRSNRGEEGTVTGRSESILRTGKIGRAYRLEVHGREPRGWGEPAHTWVPEHALEAVR